MTTIQLRIDEKIKNSAKKIFDELGMDMSSAIKYYLAQVVIRQGIPFELLTENGFTAQQEDEIIEASNEAKKGINVTTTKTWKETKAHLDSLKNNK